MTRSTMRLAQSLCALLLVPVVACSSADGADDVEPVAMSDAEALNLVENAKIREPIGEKVVTLREVGDQVQVTCSQQMQLRLAPGGPGGGGPLNCGGSCKLTAGSKLSDCKTSGCTRSGNSCTPLVCSGGCTLSKSCAPDKPTNFFYLF